VRSSVPTFSVADTKAYLSRSKLCCTFFFGGAALGFDVRYYPAPTRKRAPRKKKEEAGERKSYLHLFSQAAPVDGPIVSGKREKELYSTLKLWIEFRQATQKQQPDSRRGAKSAYVRSEI
jgi:hypothetical protein